MGQFWFMVLGVAETFSTSPLLADLQQARIVGQNYLHIYPYCFLLVCTSRAPLCTRCRLSRFTARRASVSRPLPTASFVNSANVAGRAPSFSTSRASSPSVSRPARASPPAPACFPSILPLPRDQSRVAAYACSFLSLLASGQQMSPLHLESKRVVDAWEEWADY